MEQSAPFVTVTKLEAAERQLRAAIRMFFERRDIIAVHTLTAASHEVLSQLARHRGIESIYDHAKDVIRPEKIKEFRYALRKAQNFFKHAGKDAAEKLEFYYGGTQFLLFDAARLCSFMIGRSIPECNVFVYWFIAKFPEFYIGDDPLVKTALQAAQGVDLENYEVQLMAIDHLNKYGMPTVNTKST